MIRKNIRSALTVLMIVIFCFLITFPISSSQAFSYVSSTIQLKSNHGSNREPIRGIFLNSSNLPTQNWSRIQRFILNDPTVTGANIIVPWSAIDRGPNVSPQYDWSFAYQAAQPWINAGKKVNILLWGAAQKSEQEFNNKPVTPAYVLKDTNTVSCQCKVGKGCELEPPKTPVFWDKDYQDNYRQVIKAAIAEFGNKPWIGYFRFGTGVGAESYPANGVTYANNPCNREWTKPPINLSKKRWEEHSLDFIDFLGTLKTSKTIFVTINNYGNAYDISRKLAAAAVAKGFGIGTQGLTKNAINLFNRRKPCYADWCALFKKYDPRVVVQVQTAAQSNPANKGRVGPLPPLLKFGLKRGVDVFELYQAEWFVANDRNYHLYKRYGASYRKALRDTASTLRRTFK